MIDLHPYCLTDPNMKRYDISMPWIQGGWQYATDGVIALRQKADGQPDTLQSDVSPRLRDWIPERYFSKPASCTEPWPDPLADFDTMIGCRNIAGKYALMIRKLGDVKYDPAGDKNDHLCFMAAGGLEGVVMPLRQEEGGKWQT